MLNKELYKSCISECLIENGIMKFPVLLDDRDLHEIYMQFTYDLLNCYIPHYRVVGFWHCWDDKHAKSVFRSNDIFGMSLIELGVKMADIIPLNNGGNNLAKGCFYGINEEVENNSDFDNQFGMDIGRGHENRHTNILTQSHEIIGSLMTDSYYGDPEIEVNEINTSSLWYTQYSVVDDLEFPKMLIPNKKISDLRDEGTGHACVVMFIKKDTGVLSYEETQQLFDKRAERIMPCSVTYDLSKYFLVRTPEPGDTFFNLTYLENIDENVLQQIIREYGEEF